jgi:hypothetical protein
MTFNPSDHLTKLNGKRGPQDYLEVKWRLVWLHDAEPQYSIDTEVVELTATRCVCKARVSVYSADNGSPDFRYGDVQFTRSAVGIGSETAQDFGDFIEKAQTKAIGRALAMLGFGTQFADADGFDGEAAAGRIVDAPVDPRPRQSVSEAASRPVQGIAPGERVPGGASKKQVGFIRKLASEAGMDDIELHEFMKGETGKESAT